MKTSQIETIDLSFEGSRGHYDYVTGDIIMHPDIFGMHGRCWFDPLVPGDARYFCELDSRNLDEGEQTCFKSVTWNVLPLNSGKERN